jgi:hypothetical protein
LEEYDPTINDCLVKQLIVDSSVCRVQFICPHFTDSGPYYQHNKLPCIKNSEVCILFYSITDRGSFASIPYLYSEVIRIKEELRHVKESARGTTFLSSTADYPVILVGNMTDLHDEWVVTMEEGQELARELSCEFYEVSAKTGDNVSRVQDILRMMVQVKRALTGGQDCYVRHVAAEMEGVEGSEPAKKKKRCTIL